MILGCALFLVRQGQVAIPAYAFLNSIGVNSAISARGETLDHTIECTNYLGIRWFRSGIEGDVPLDDLLKLHERTGAEFSWSPGSGGSNLPKLLETARILAQHDALLAFEGPNEPNNWPITYQGTKGGGNLSWQAVANFQRDLYQSVKADKLLNTYPVWGVSEAGAETDNVGLQFLTVPDRGPTYSDFANVHNYVYHPNAPGLEDNKTWKASEPGPECKVDGLFGEYGVTWARHFNGYSASQLNNLPKVTTETGVLIDGPITENVQANNLLSLYLDQFARGWSHTAVYLLRDRVDEAGNQKFGFYKPDYTPRKAAVYLHNLTTILADQRAPKKLGRLEYEIQNRAATTHDLLLEKSDGSFALVVWSELLQGENTVTVSFHKSFRQIRVFDPTVSSAPARALANASSVGLSLTDHPFIVMLR